VKRRSLLIILPVLALAAGFAPVFGAQDPDLPGLDLPAPPELERAEEISLGEAMRLADTRNRDLNALRTDLAAAAASLKDSWAGLLPSVYGSAAYTLYDHNEVSTQNNQSVETRARHALSAGVTISAPLVSAGQWLMVGLARQQRDVSRLTVENARQELLYAVGSAYVQAAAQQALVEVFETQVDAVKRHLAVALRRYQTGAGSLTEVTQARTELAGVAEGLHTAFYAVAKSRDALALLCGSTMPLKPGPTPEDIAPLPGATGDDAALSARLDLRLARGQEAAATTALKAQYLQFVPTVSLNFGFNYAFITPDNPLAAVDQSRWTLGLNLSVPLFDYGIYPSLDAKKAALAKATLSAEALTLEAASRLRQARRDVEQARDLVLTAGIKQDLARQTLSMTETDYALGTGSALAVVDARRSLHAARVDVLSRRLDLLLARLGLAREEGTDLGLLAKEP